MVEEGKEDLEEDLRLGLVCSSDDLLVDCIRAWTAAVDLGRAGISHLCFSKSWLVLAACYEPGFHAQYDQHSQMLNSGSCRQR